jgi:hypothetical protein
MCHRLGRERDGVLGVETAGNFKARMYASTSTRFVPSRAERLRSSGLVLFVDVFFYRVFFFFGSPVFRGTIVVSRGVSALNLCGATCTRADLRTAGVGRGFGGGALRGGPVAIAEQSGGRAASADSMPVSIRLAMSARILSSRAGCAFSPDMFRGRGPLRTSWSNHRTAAQGKRFSKRSR